MNDKYTSPLASRYASDYMLKLFSPQGRIETWRKLWVALAKAENKILRAKLFGTENAEQTRALIDENWIEVAISEKLFNAITLFQDTVHETAIEYHRKLREQSATKSALDEIEGIGEKKRNLLLQEFKTIEKIKQSSIEELTKINGINEELADRILKELKK